MARILCVDDEERVLRALGQILKRQGHEFVPAKNAGEALHLHQEHPADLILTDFQLPGIDGLELLAMLRRDRDRTPVIVLTGHGSIDHAMKAVRAGADDYLLKPADPMELLHRVEQALNHRKVARELDELRHEVEQQRSERWSS